MSVKVQAATEHHLCVRCEHGQQQIFNNGEEHISCHVNHPPLVVRRPVVRCTEFEDRNQPSKWQMEKIAWVVKTDREGTTIGFKPPPVEKA